MTNNPPPTTITKSPNRCSKSTLDMTSKMINISYLIIVLIGLSLMTYLIFLFLEYFGIPLWLNVIIIILITIPLMIIILSLIYKRQCAETTSDIIAL